jgi:phosphatidylglycerol:prolipoprotein diacylglycerol transferase
MYPELFTVFGVTVSTFGLMLAVAFLVGSWLAGVRMEEEGLDREQASSILIYAIIGGVLGAKLYYAVDVSIREAERSFSQLFFSRDGMTWYGGLLLGTLAGALGCRIHGIPVKRFADCAAVPAAIGQAIGRLGCFLVGDDYGRATDVAWGVRFPRGVPPVEFPVHPTQLYEAAWLLLVAALLWRRRKVSPFLFGEYAALNGLGRIVIENWRVNPSVALGMTEPQWIGVGLIAAGLGGWLYFASARRAAA